MSRWLLTIALLLSLGLNLGIVARWLHRRAPEPKAAEAQAGTRPAAISSARVERIVERMATELELRGDRRARFLEIQSRFFRQTINGRMRIARGQRQLRQALTRSDVDRAKIDRHLERLAAAHLELERLMVDSLLETRELLGPDQERRYLRFVERMRRSVNRGIRR